MESLGGTVAADPAGDCVAAELIANSKTPF